MVIVKSELFDLWAEKEREQRRRITIMEVAEATGLDPKAIGSLRRGKTQRFDAHVLAKLCKYFGVAEGEPIPFLRVHYPKAKAA